MICYSIRLLKILPDKADHVVKALRQEGLFAELKKEIPGHIGCSILESDLNNDLYLVIDFWESKYDFFESEISPSSIFLNGVLDRLAYQHFAFGPFSFPPTPAALNSRSVGLRIHSDTERFGEAEPAELATR
jgi:antibiotic biosynthesis monooxygenase